MLVAMVRVLVIAAALAFAGCGGAARKPAVSATPTPKPAAPQHAAERCGDPDKPARLVNLTTSDGLKLDGVSVGKGALGVVLLHEYPADLCGWWPYANY